MSAFNTIMNGLFDLICFPFSGMHPVVGLTVVSLVAGVLLLLLFKYTSPQKAIAATKERLWGNLHEVQLYKDDLGVITRAIGRLLKENGLYFCCASVALIPMILVVLPILFQLDARYGFSPLKQGDMVVLDVFLSEGQSPVDSQVSLELPDAVELEAGPVRVTSTRELVYRLRVKEEGEHMLTIKVDGEEYTKRLDAVAGLSTVSPARFSTTETLDALMFPAEKPYPGDGKLQAVKLNHNRAAMLGMDGDMYPWLVIFSVVGLLFGFALKGVLKVNL